MNTFKIYSNEEANDWREVLNSMEEIKEFTIKNLSDYSGVEYEVTYIMR